MRNIIILLITAFLLQSCAQVKWFRVKEESAVLGGVGLTDVHRGESWSPKVGGQLGVETKILKFDNNSSLNTGLGVTFQGAAYEDYFSGKIATSYINIPILYTFESKVGIYGEAGLQPGLLMTAKDKFNGESFNRRSEVSNFELGLPIGAGYTFNKKLSIGSRVNFGLLNFNKTGDGEIYRNFSLSAIVRYKIKMSRKKTPDKI